MTIRHATMQDLPILLQMGRDMAAESPRYSRLKFDDAKVLALISDLISSLNGVVIVSEIEGVVIGAVVGGVTQNWFSSDLMGYEYGVFVAKIARNGTSAVRLINRFMSECRELGATMIQMGISTGVHTKETATLYRAIGLVEYGNMFEVRF